MFPRQINLLVFDGAEKSHSNLAEFVVIFGHLSQDFLDHNILNMLFNAGQGSVYGKARSLPNIPGVRKVLARQNRLLRIKKVKCLLWSFKDINPRTSLF